MFWHFKTADTITPDLVTEELPVEDSNIVETEYTGCAWCGDGEGICSYHQSQMFTQSTERAEKRAGRR